ncbi:amidohydrolase family protein [candidate division KSB1 bacterium]
MRDKYQKIFDSHFHIGTWGERPWGDPPRSIRPIGPEQDHHGPAECSRYLDRNGFDGGLVIPSYLPDPTVAFEKFNPLVRAAVEADPRLLGALWLSPEPVVFHLTKDVLQSEQHINIVAGKMSASTWGGATVDPATWSAEIKRNMEFILKTCAERGWVVHLHTGSGPADPALFDSFMAVCGKWAVYQLVHMGESLHQAFKFVPRFREWIENGYDVYCDTSLVPGFAPRWLVELMEDFPAGHDRILFATDAPWGLAEAELVKITGSDIPSAIVQNILWNNAQRLYRLAERIL